MESLFPILAALIGLLLGGAINALADDLPLEDPDLRLPHYPDGTPRPRSAWLGLLAFLTGRRASPGGAKLSWRHPLTELATAFLCWDVAIQRGFTGLSFFWFGVMALLVLITVIDLEHRLILFVTIIPGCIYAIIGAALFAVQIAPLISFTDYLWGGAIGFGVFTLLYLGGMLFNSIMTSLRQEEMEEVAFGYGDVMLATLSGLILGWQALIFAIFIAIFAGAAGALIYLVARAFSKGGYEVFTALPYGQYIVFGTIVMMLWRTPLLNYLQGAR